MILWWNTGSGSLGKGLTAWCATNPPAAAGGWEAGRIPRKKAGSRASPRKPSFYMVRIWVVRKAISRGCRRLSSSIYTNSASPLNQELVGLKLHSWSGARDCQCLGCCALLETCSMLLTREEAGGFLITLSCTWQEGGLHLEYPGDVRKAYPGIKKYKATYFQWFYI